MPNVLASPEVVKSVVPPRLAGLTRWTAWALTPPKKPGAKPGKKPLSLTNDASTWVSLDEALRLAALQPSRGVGFQLFGVTTLVGIDLDNCLDDLGAPTELAQSILDALPHTYAEISPSGTGLRLFASVPEGSPPPAEFLSREAGVECYVGKSARFLTVTGRVLPGREQLLADLTPDAYRLLGRIGGAGAEVIEVEIQLPVPGTPRIEEWKKIFDTKRGRPDKHLMLFLEAGEVPGARSERVFSVATFMLSRLYSLEETFAVLHSAPGSWEAALDKRDQDPTRARALIWADIGRAQKIIQAENTAVEGQADLWASCGLHVEVIAKKLRVVQSQQNAFRVLSAHESWRGRLAMDITTGLVLLDGTNLDDARFFDLQEKVTRFCQWSPNASRQWWTDVLRSVAEGNKVNTREAWLRSLKWDGTPRLDAWLNERVAAKPDDLNVQIGRKWLISLVARWIQPGCKVDTVLILAGSEGTRKSTFFEVMAGGADRVVDLEGFDRDNKFTMARAWIVEMPEGHLLRRADNNKLKGFITKPTDDYRVPYASAPVTVYRGFVFVSTSNRGDELFQATQDGLRRYWPVLVRDAKIDLKWITEHREQLLAEAVVAYDLGEPWWFDDAPAALKIRISESVEASSVDEAIERLVVAQAGKGGMSLNAILSEVTATVGQRPNERQVTALLGKHGIMRKRTGQERFWMHHSWEAKEESNVVPFKTETGP